MAKDTGGAAFPLDVNGDTHGEVNEGMSLRDYFASSALNGLCAANPKIGDANMDDAFMAMAIIAYQMADCMIAVRNKDA